MLIPIRKTKIIKILKWLSKRNYYIFKNIEDERRLYITNNKVKENTKKLTMYKKEYDYLIWNKFIKIIPIEYQNTIGWMRYKITKKGKEYYVNNS